MANIQPKLKGKTASSQNDDFLRAQDVMTREITVVSPQSFLDEALYLFESMNVLALAIFDGPVYMGALARKDLEDFLNLKGVRLTDVMTSRHPVCLSDEPLSDARAMMQQARVDWIPVLDDAGRLAGILLKSRCPCPASTITV